MTIEELKRLCATKFCIPVEEDYGYREWIWFPPVSKAEIEGFWRSQTSFDGAPDTCLPGKWVGGAEDDESGAFHRLYIALWRRPDGYALHFDGNISAGLLTPDGRAIFHQGFVEQERSDRDRIIRWAESRVRAASHE